MYSTLNRIFIPSILDISSSNDILDMLNFKPPFERNIIKMIVIGGTVNDKIFNTPNLAPIGCNPRKFIDYINLINSDLREIYSANVHNWTLSNEEKLLIEHFCNEALKDHSAGFILSSKIESSVFSSASSYVSSDHPLLRAFPQATDFLKIITARFMYLLELNPNISSLINLGNFPYSSLTGSILAVSLIGGEVLHNVDLYSMTSASGSFDTVQSYLDFKRCVFDNVNSLLNVISTDGLQLFLSLESTPLPCLPEIFKTIGPENLSSYLITNLNNIKIPFYLGHVFLPIIKGILGLTTSINPHLGHFSAEVLIHLGFYTVSTSITVFKFFKVSSVIPPLEQVAVSLNPQDMLGYHVPLKKVIFMIYSLILIGGVVAQKLG